VFSRQHRGEHKVRPYILIPLFIYNYGFIKRKKLFSNFLAEG